MPKDEDMPADPMLLLGHENRIAKLESDVTDQKVETGRIAQQIHDSFEHIAESLDDVKSAVKSTSGKVDALSEQVSTLEQTHKQKKERRESFWKIALPICTTILGVAMKFLFDYITKH